MGVMLMIVIMMMEVKTSKHIVQTERQLRSELLLMLTVHNLFFMSKLNNECIRKYRATLVIL